MLLTSCAVSRPTRSKETVPHARLLGSCSVLDLDLHAEVAESAEEALRDLVFVMVQEILHAKVVKLDAVAEHVIPGG